MKLSTAAVALSAAAVVPATIVSAYQMGGFDVFGRPYIVSPRGRTRAGRSRCAPSSNQNECVDQAFQDLAKELQQDRFQRSPRRRGGERGQFSSSPRTPFGQPFRMDEESLRQQEEWINRAFGLATDVAKGVAKSPREEQEAKDAIRQSKQFVDSMFGFAQELSSPTASGGRAYTSVSSEILQDDVNGFEVAIDVPGCKISDLDVAVEGAQDKLLVVRGKREMGGKSKDADEKIPTSKEFRKVFALDSSSVVDKISVVLENGVLMVSVPREASQAAESSVKVAVTKLDDDSSMEESEEQSFALEIDVPGVSASNIEVTIEGDSDKTMVVTATREVGKESDGSPKTRQISKTFKVDEFVDTSKLVATLSNGVLRVKAPADKKKKENFVRKIDVTQASTSSTTDTESTNDEDKAAEETSEDDQTSNNDN